MVSDVVEAIRNGKHNIPTLWADEEAQTGDPLALKASFFFRLPKQELEQAKQVFSNISLSLTEGVLTEEVGVITGKLTQTEFIEKLEKLRVSAWLRVEGID